MFEIRNLNAWKRKTAAMKAKLQGQATAHVQKEALKILKVILRESPQYSGDFVANWRVVTNLKGSSGYTEWNYKQVLEDAALSLGVKSPEYLSMLRQAGHSEAIAFALEKGVEVISSVKWNTKIRFENRTPIADSVAVGQLSPAYRPVHQHLEGQSFLTYIKQKRGMGWIG